MTNRRLRIWLALFLLRSGEIAMTLWLGYIAWLCFRWSLIVAPVSEEARRAAVRWWDMNGHLWGYCRWPKPLENEHQPS